MALSYHKLIYHFYDDIDNSDEGSNVDTDTFGRW